MRSRVAAGGIRRRRDRRRRRPRVGAGRAAARTSPSTRCTAAGARTAASRASSSGSRIPYTHSGRARLGARHGQEPRQGDLRRRRPAGGAPGVLVCRERGPRPRTRCRRPTWSSRTTRAPRSGSTSCRRAPTARRSSPTTCPSVLLVEEYVAGRELTTTVMGDRALAVTDIIADGWYDYHAKYAPGGSRHVVPAEIPAEIEAACLDYALRAHRALGCRGVSRTDFRWDEARGLGGLDPARDQHPAGHDPDLARARAGGACAASPSGRWCAGWWRTPHAPGEGRPRRPPAATRRRRGCATG